MRLSRWPVLIALLGVAACSAAPGRGTAARCGGALDDAATARLLMAGFGGAVPVFGSGSGCGGKALAFEAPREHRRRAQTNGVLIALKP